MMENKPCRRELMDWINVVSFAVDDVKLFLDTLGGEYEIIDAYFFWIRILDVRKHWNILRNFRNSVWRH